MALGPKTDSAPSAPDFMSGGGEMAALMRTVNWANTHLGEIEHWPQSLRTSISICLASRFPIVLYWGPEYTVLYNDAYSTILGSKHPLALGQRCHDCWAEIWDTIGPMLDGVITTGEATWSDDLLLQLQRFGYTEECYFSFSFSPVRIETGAIGGVFTAVIETTERLIAERRLNTLRELAAHIANADSENEMFALAAEILSKNRYDISFSVLYLLSSDGKYFEPKVSTGIPPSHFLCNGKKELDRLESSLLIAVGDVLRSGKASVVTDLQSLNLPLGIWGVAPSEAIALPVVVSGHSTPVGSLLVGLNPRKRLDQDYRVFVELCASQLASSLAAARAHEEERKRADMLAELDRAKTLFFSNVSHEFRTPLTLMVGPLEAMLDRAHPSAVVSKEELQLVHRNSMRLLKLVNTLLDFSRIQAGRVQAIYEPTDIATLTADTASAFRSAMEQAGLEFVIDCPPVTEPAYIDRDMWEKIVLNLISNAFKFTLAGGVTVRLRAVEDKIELQVADTGLGIPEEQQPKVFKRFHRVEGVRGRTHEGTGIGLALVQELARLHGGTIRVESTLGKGSTFLVSIPRGRAHLPAEQLSKGRILSSTGVSASAYVHEALRWLPETEQPAELPRVFASDSVQAPHIQAATGRILLADDNADMREYVRRLLGNYYDVRAVSNGLQALAAARRYPPDLVLTDVMMPGIDGFSLLRELRAAESTSTIPVILLSARAGEDARIEGIQAGADDYIVKPFTARELLARVSAHLALSRLRQQGAERERALRAELEVRVEQRTAELQAANRQLRELSSRLQQIQDQERRRLARELHDSAGQLLTALSLNIASVKAEAPKLSSEAAKRIDENSAIIEQLSKEIRTISHLLHPPLLDEVGLSSALRWYVDGFAERSRITATLDIPEDLGRFPADVEIAIFRAVQESLTNVHRHSGSPSCCVEVVQGKNHLAVEIRDEGKGIPKEKQLNLTSLGSGVGLRGMAERLRHLGGTLEVKSSENGTRVLVSLPISPAVVPYDEDTA
jgi:signal transduction histidine kinase